MKKEGSVRYSNYELMRIVSIMFVIIGHTFLHGGIVDNATPGVYNLIKFVYAIIIIHVNSFVLVSGYFQSKLKFKISKALKLLFYMWLYTLLIMVVGMHFGWFEVSKIDLIKAIIPINFLSYWYIKMYIVLYCLSPFLNKAIAALSKKDYRRLLLAMFILCSLVTTISNQTFYPNSRGYSLVNFVFLYFKT